MQHPHLQEHIDLIARHEQDYYKNRTHAERIGDAIAVFAGSLSFVAVHLVLFTAWIVVNSLQTTQRWHFDPYPYGMLNTIITIEAILLASFILMRQTRMSKRADQREHLMLQVLLLTEKEATKLLEVNVQMAERLGLRDISRDEELSALTEEVSIDEVAENIREALPADQ